MGHQPGLGAGAFEKRVVANSHHRLFALREAYGRRYVINGVINGHVINTNVNNSVRNLAEVFP